MTENPPVTFVSPSLGERYRGTIGFGKIRPSPPENLTADLVVLVTESANPLPDADVGFDGVIDRVGDLADDSRYVGFRDLRMVQADLGQDLGEAVAEAAVEGVVAVGDGVAGRGISFPNPQECRERFKPRPIN